MSTSHARRHARVSTTLALALLLSPFAVAAQAPVVNAASPAGPGALPAPFTPEESRTLCVLNTSTDYQSVDPSRATVGSWILFDGGEDPRSAFARVKAEVIATPGMRVVSEHYSGKRGSLDLASLVPESMGIPAYEVPLRVEIDEDMGLVWAAVRTNMELVRFVGPQVAAAYPCKLAAIASRTPLPADMKPTVSVTPKRQWFHNPFKKSGAPEASTRSSAESADDRLAARAHDALYERARHAGKAFLIVPVLDVETKYRDIQPQQLQTEQLAPYWADGSGHVIWRSRSEAGDEIAAGAWTSRSSVGLHGFVDSLLVGKSRYALYIVEPGTYDLRAAKIERRGSVLPPPQGKPVAKPVGTVVATRTMDSFYEMSKEWHDATYTTQSYEQPYCARVLAASGQCVEWSSQRQQYNTQNSAAEYRDKVVEKKVPGLAMMVKLPKPFASFEVRRGDVALVDGFIFDRDGIEVDSHCKVSGSDSTCGLGSFAPWRVPARLDDITKSLDLLKPGSPERRIFSEAKAPTLNVDAVALPEPGKGYEAGWARRYEVSAH